MSVVARANHGIHILGVVLLRLHAAAEHKSHNQNILAHSELFFQMKFIVSRL